jgi:protein TonB
MSYAAPQRYSSRQIALISFAVALHLLLGYALVNGLGRKVVDVLKKPLEVAVIEEVKSLPPPPPPKALPPPPKVAAPPPSFVPQVEVPVAAPTPVITTSKAPTPEPPPVAQAAPAPIAVSVACPNQASVRSKINYPAQAQRMGINSGDVIADFTLTTGGEIRDVVIVKSTNPVFNATVLEAIGKLQCASQGRDAKVRIPFAFRMDN